MNRALFGAGMVVMMAVGCSTEPSGSLEIVLDAGVPSATNQSSVTLSGTVKRTPAIKTVYIVTVAKGTFTVADTIDSTGHFAIKAPLALESLNAFQLGATDAQGSVAPSVSLTISQDDQPPDLATTTPAAFADGVARSQRISFTLTEPARADTVVLVHQGFAIDGTLSIAADSINGTFTPTSSLLPNSIYTLVLVGLHDAAGNQDTVTSCFVTGGANALTGPNDTSSQHYTAGSPNTAVRPTLLQLRWARSGALLTGIIQFAVPRSIVQADPNNVSVVLDLDVDQNSATGFKSFRDTVLAPNGPSVMSGIGTDYTIQMVSIDANGFGGAFAAADSGVALYRNAGAVAFLQDVCGPFLGFTVPFSALGNDDGKMNYTLIAITDDPNGSAYAEVMPTSGPLTVDASVSVGAPPIAFAPLIPTAAPGVRHPIAPLRAPRILRPFRARSHQ